MRQRFVYRMPLGSEPNLKHHDANDHGDPDRLRPDHDDLPRGDRSGLDRVRYRVDVNGHARSGHDPGAAAAASAATDGHVALSWSAVAGATTYQVYRSTGTETPTLVATTTATSLTDVGGTAGIVYAYSIVPLLASGPAVAQAQTANATWAAATSNPEVLSAQPSSGTLSGSVALSVDGQSGDGVGTVTWSIVKSDGTVTQIGTATGAAQSTDPLTWTARTVWDSQTATDGSYTLTVTVADGSSHATQTASQVRSTTSARRAYCSWCDPGRFERRADMAPAGGCERRGLPRAEGR